MARGENRNCCGTEESGEKENIFLECLSLLLIYVGNIHVTEAWPDEASRSCDQSSEMQILIFYG